MGRVGSPPPRRRPQPARRTTMTASA